MTMNETLMEVVHLASAALVADLSEVKRHALADIYDAIASVLPGERAAPSADAADDAGGLEGLDKFHTVAPGVKLVRFAGPDEVRLLARRKGVDATPNAVFEIEVNKASKVAAVMRNGKIIFEVAGYATNYSAVERMAVDALRRYLKVCASRNRRSHKRSVREGGAR